MNKFYIEMHDRNEDCLRVVELYAPNKFEAIEIIEKINEKLEILCCDEQ